MSARLAPAAFPLPPGRAAARAPSISRRVAIRRLGVLAAGGAVAGCTGRSVRGHPAAAAGAPAGRRRWAPVTVAPDRVTRTLVGLRPFRAPGFVVRTDVLDGKPIIHNYGHGGGGITLSWGTAHLAMEEAARVEARDAAVIGCGAVGLATARLLQRHGWTVRVYARDLPPETTSNVAAGQWAPFSVYDSSAATDAFLSRFRRAAALAFRHYQDLVGPDYGVSWIDNYYTSERPIEPGALERDMPELFPRARDLAPEEHPFPASHVRRVTSMLVETSAYLRALEADVRRAGAEIVVREFADPAELVALPESVIVNCTGLGARDLFGDRELVPVRGQLLVLLPEPCVDYILVQQGTALYMMPRRDGIVLGGSFERGEWSLRPDPATTRRLLEGHARFFGAMR